MTLEDRVNLTFEDKVNRKLLLRGFTKKQLLNNRGLIGATIDEVILLVVKHNNL